MESPASGGRIAAAEDVGSARSIIVHELAIGSIASRWPPLVSAPQERFEKEFDQ